MVDRLRDGRFQRTDGGRVTRERPIGEGVDLVDGKRRHARRLAECDGAGEGGRRRRGYRQRKPLPMPPLGLVVVLIVFCRQTVTTLFQPLQALKPWVPFG